MILRGYQQIVKKRARGPHSAPAGVPDGVQLRRDRVRHGGLRAHAVTFLARAVKATASGSAGFRDVADSAYYAKAVKWATDNAITNGIAPGLFGPDYNCTRAQIVTFLWRLYAGR